VDAVVWLEQACRLGDRFACEYRWWRFPGDGFPPAGELDRWQAACDTGDAGRCVSLGYMYANAQGVTIDLERGFSLAKRACDAGSGDGCFLLAELYGGAFGHSADDQRALPLLERACALGDPRGCQKLGDKLLAARPDGAMTHLRTACDAGAPTACRHVAAALVERHQGADAESKELTERACRGTRYGADILSCEQIADNLRRTKAPRDEWVPLYGAGCDSGQRTACEQYWIAFGLAPTR
jgi:hypothetical protein